MRGSRKVVVIEYDWWTIFWLIVLGIGLVIALILATWAFVLGWNNNSVQSTVLQLQSDVSVLESTAVVLQQNITELQNTTEQQAVTIMQIEQVLVELGNEVMSESIANGTVDFGRVLGLGVTDEITLDYCVKLLTISGFELSFVQVQPNTNLTGTLTAATTQLGFNNFVPPLQGSSIVFSVVFSTQSQMSVLLSTGDSVQGYSWFGAPQNFVLTLDALQPIGTEFTVVNKINLLTGAF